MEKATQASETLGNRHVQWLADWRISMDALEIAPDDSMVEAELSETAQALSAQLAVTPATSPDSLAAQIAWFKEELGGYVFGNASPAHYRIFETLAKAIIPVLNVTEN